jgi:hypothetical protein
VRESSGSNVAWRQLRDAYGSAEEVGELLNQIAAGDDAWGELYNRVLHQGTLYEATVPVASWLVHALQAGTIGKRMIAVGRNFGTDEVLSESTLAFGLLSAMAESARDAINQTGCHKSSGQTKENYASIGVGVLEALRPGIRLYERGLADPEEDVREASAALIEAVAIDH